MKKPGEANKGKRAAVSFGQCLVYEYDKDSASTTAAKKVDSKDISDMRDEKTKIRDMLQAKENEMELRNAQLVAHANEALAVSQPMQHPVFGELLHDYGHKRLYRASPLTLWAGPLV